MRVHDHVDGVAPLPRWPAVEKPLRGGDDEAVVLAQPAGHGPVQWGPLLFKARPETVGEVDHVDVLCLGPIEGAGRCLRATQLSRQNL